MAKELRPEGRSGIKIRIANEHQNILMNRNGLMKVVGEALAVSGITAVTSTV